MLKNYLLVALRIMKRRPFFSAINILGLGLAMAASLTIFQYVAYHFSFDREVPGAENIYRIGAHYVKSGDYGTQNELTVNLSTNSALTERIEDDFPQVEACTQFQLDNYIDNTAKPEWLGVIESDYLYIAKPESIDKPIKSLHFAYADSSFFKVFQYTFVNQASPSPLNDLNTAVISSAFAKRIFETENPIGQILVINANNPVKVTGVFENPKNASMDFELILRGNTRMFWGKNVFVRLKKESNISAFEKSLKVRQDYWEKTYKDKNIVLAEHFLQPLREVHFKKFAGENIPTVTYKKEVFSFLVFIGFLILGIAWVNTINLTLSQLINRSKEISLRKVVGASKVRLYAQGTLEFMLINILALAIGLTISQVSLPYLASNGLDYDPTFLYTTPFFWILSILTLCLVSLISILFQAKFLNATAHGQSKIARSSSPLLKKMSVQKSLLVFQFICTSGLLIGITIVSGQIQYILDKDLGFNPENVVIIKAPTQKSDNDILKFRQFVKKCNQQTGVQIAGSVSIPGKGKQDQGYLYHPGSSKPSTTYSNGFVTSEFINVYGIELTAGRNLKSSDASLRNPWPILISTNKAKSLGYDPPESALHANIIYTHYGARNDTSSHLKSRVVGIYNEYQMLPLNSESFDLGSFIVLKSDDRGWNIEYFSVKFDPDSDQKNLAIVQHIYNQTFPNSPFDYFSFGDDILSKYESEQIIKSLLTYLTGLAVLISCLGLFALISISLAQRTKEIGIRKVLGASFFNIFSGMSKSYLLTVLTASMIGIPVVWYFASEWLAGFSEHIEITWTMMLMPITALTVLVLSILIFQIYRTANANPIESLRTE